MLHCKKSNRGFTLMEMLIVVAIIAILVAIAIPTMSKSLHKAREAADLANARAYYAYLQADYLTTGEYLPNFSDEYERNITDTIVYPDGTTVKLQTGVIGVYIPPVSRRDQQSGYQVHYICNKLDRSYSFGASG